MCLTILIPAYNVETTIMRTLSSLDSQIDDDFNVIVYSDGSTDNTDFLASTWCYANPNAEFYKGEHAGVGATRERLFEKCETEHLTFLDADDVLLPHAVKFMNQAIRENDEDILLFRFYKELEKSLVIYSEQHGLTWCFGKVYRKSFIKKNDITFDPGLRTGEDSYFNAVCFELGTYKVFPFPVAIWCENPNSITRKDGKDGLFNIVLDNVKGMLLAFDFLRDKKSLSDIRFIKPNIAVIKANIEGIDEYMTVEQKTEIMEYYSKFIEIGETQNGNR